MLLFSRIADRRDGNDFGIRSRLPGSGVSRPNHAGNFEHNGREQFDEGDLCVFLPAGSYRTPRFGDHIHLVDTGRGHRGIGSCVSRREIETSGGLAQ